MVSWPWLVWQNKMKLKVNKTVSEITGSPCMGNIWEISDRLTIYEN
jgi:hypothetical protein